MSDSSLSLQMKVVLLKNGAKFYLEKTRAQKVESLLQSPNRPEYIDIDDTLVAVREISMVASADKIDEMNRERRGDWRCSKGHWHAKNESVCKNDWGMTVARTPETVVKKEKLTPNQQKRVKLIKKLMSEQDKSMLQAIKIVNKIYPPNS